MIASYAWHGFVGLRKSNTPSAQMHQNYDNDFTYLRRNFDTSSASVRPTSVFSILHLPWLPLPPSARAGRQHNYFLLGRVHPQVPARADEPLGHPGRAVQSYPCPRRNVGSPNNHWVGPFRCITGGLLAFLVILVVLRRYGIGAL